MSISSLSQAAVSGNGSPLPQPWQHRLNTAVEVLRHDAAEVAASAAAFAQWAHASHGELAALASAYAELLPVLGGIYRSDAADLSPLRTQALELLARFALLGDVQGELLAAAACVIADRYSGEKNSGIRRVSGMVGRVAQMPQQAPRVLVANCCAVAYTDVGDTEQSAVWFYFALRDTQALGLVAREAHISANISEMLYMSGNVQAAQELLDRAAELSMLEPSTWLNTFVRTVRGLCHLANDQPQAALEALQPLIDAPQSELGFSQLSHVWFYATAALVLADCGDLDAAQRHVERAKAVANRLSEAQLSPYAWWASGHLLRLRGQPEQAVIELEEAIERSAESGYAFMSMHAAREIFEIYRLQGRFEHALAAHERYHQLHHRVNRQTAQLTLKLLQTEAELVRRRTDAEQQRELGKLKSRFIAMASHEFRTPLAAIQSAVELLQHYQDRMDAEERDRVLVELDGSVQRLKFTMDQVLTLAKSDASALPVRLEPIDWMAASLDIVREQHLALMHRNPILWQGVAPDVLCLRPGIDLNLFRQALGNLLSNACKYSAHGQSVRLQALHLPATPAQGAALCIQVMDGGLGIRDEDKERLFATFERGSNTEHISGTGLGLAIVKRAMQAMGGSVQFTSTLGQGSVFGLYFPL